jgi:hypothetical protein
VAGQIPRLRSDTQIPINFRKYIPPNDPALSSFLFLCLQGFALNCITHSFSCFVKKIYLTYLT